MSANRKVKRALEIAEEIVKVKAEANRLAYRLGQLEGEFAILMADDTKDPRHDAGSTRKDQDDSGQRLRHRAGTMRDRILEYLSMYPDKAFTHYEIAVALKLKPESTRMALSALARDDLVARPKRGYWLIG